MRRFKIVILTSGKSRGSNFEAIYNTIKQNNLPIDIAAVYVNSKKAPIIDKCHDFGISVKYLSTKDMLNYQHEVKIFLAKEMIDMVVLAGFMKLLPEIFVTKVRIPILNIHPALLPKFGGKGMYGMNVHEAVFKAKESFSGITIHRVNSYYDEGKIIFQKKVKVAKAKSSEIIAQRVLKLEHKYYGKVIYSYLKEFYA